MIAGVLPDVDSDNAVILREVLALVAAIFPMLLLDRFRSWQWSQETIVVASALIYVIVRFGVGGFIRRTTIHRGMWHSLPAAANVGMVVYLLCDGPSEHARWLKTAAVVVGFLWHLVLDEFYAIETTLGRIRLKRSFGTAWKFFGPRQSINFLTYGITATLAALTFLGPSALGVDRLYEHAGYPPISTLPVTDGYPPTQDQPAQTNSPPSRRAPGGYPW